MAATGDGNAQFAAITSGACASTIPKSLSTVLAIVDILIHVEVQYSKKIERGALSTGLSDPEAASRCAQAPGPVARSGIYNGMMQLLVCLPHSSYFLTFLRLFAFTFPDVGDDGASGALVAFSFLHRRAAHARFLSHEL